MKRLFFLSIVVMTFSCRRAEDSARPVPSEQRTVAPAPTLDECPPDVETPPPMPLPEHVARITNTEIYVRVTTDAGPDLVVAPPEDLAVVRAYPTGRVRGPLDAKGTRVTILTAKKTYRVGEEIRVVHVAEFNAKGDEVFVMGPKPVTGEYLDDELVSEAIPSWGPFTMGVYDGAVVKSPWVDTNYEITTYRIAQRGLHRLQWRAGTVLSNVLCVRVD
jgi:hypothetical protein